MPQAGAYLHSETSIVEFGGFQQKKSGFTSEEDNSLLASAQTYSKCSSMVGMELGFVLKRVKVLCASS